MGASRKIPNLETIHFWGLHTGKLIWNLKITIIFQTSTIVFHVNIFSGVCWFQECFLLQMHSSFVYIGILCTLPEANSLPLKIGKAPKGEEPSPNPHFQGRAVSFREGKWNIEISVWVRVGLVIIATILNIKPILFRMCETSVWVWLEASKKKNWSPHDHLLSLLLDAISNTSLVWPAIWLPEPYSWRTSFTQELRTIWQ